MAYTALGRIRVQILVFLMLFSFYCQASVKIHSPSDAFTRGHMKPLGSHGALTPIPELKSMPTPDIFYALYSKPGKPVVLRNAARAIPAFDLWTDEYLTEKFGKIKVLVEEGKKENRSKGNFMTSIRRFIKTYKTEDLYVVHTIPMAMREDIRLLPCVSCGGFAEKLLDIVMWFSSGGTKSVLHNDGSDNLNCLFRGFKEFILVDRDTDYSGIVDNNGFSNMDVDKVDLNTYSDLLKIELYKTTLSAGDCIFIPHYWLHHVRSYGSNLAVNMWWTPLTRFNRTTCKNNNDNTYLKAVDYEFATYEVLRKQILDAMLLRKMASKQKFRKILLDCEVGEIKFIDVFSAFDKDKNGKISINEVHELPYGQFSKLFPNWHYQTEESNEMEPDRDEL
ncbi:Lysine-specific demethylase 8 [Trichoplax sp. H2]|uniref:JmjC domain-containing protein n=1 Tax=Trichoplax adhaerens TaxID=10228 RepID=B3RRL9_TRIAD|nr:hypothetical protein TRIADDRAFT_54288 [Trichoplax adhaerens]EDV26373.1 hypothetical protein TRIADDRAFT_54288 [Trichoplax adhaerens]RDD36087.1 Lysine-specific demethylase 8 [Trichoplax sp. H2]|eukprot:XP_002110369.1 hypothetical protein TRIADDRAFT_54288 [Trichoplax adhaerens]